LLADDRLRHDFAGRDYDQAELARLPVLDPTTTVRADVATLLDYPNLSARVRVSGCGY
jgi:hypothetical protein